MRLSDFTTNVERFWSKVDRSGDCWLWQGQQNNAGYGRFEFWQDGIRTRVLAHRLALSLVGVVLAADEVVMHACDIPACVNPAHLSVGSQADNIRDAHGKGRLNLDGLAFGTDARYGRYRKEAS